MQSQQLANSSAFSRLDPETTARIRRGKSGKATTTQSAVEYLLFGVFGVTIVLSLVAFIVINSPQHKIVPNRVAAGLAGGRVNVLLIGTELRDGVTDTESLTVVSIKPATHQVAMISIPRDLRVKLGRYGVHRLAAVESVGQSSGYPGEGTGLTADTVEQITGQPVHAYVRLDADDLCKTIDAMGGIDVRIEHSFYEYKARDRFYAGRQHLDGTRAVRFAKSPFVLGPQSDRFARELREQQVIAAVLPALLNAKDTNLAPAQIATLTSSIRTADTFQHVSLEPLMDVIDTPSFGDAQEALQPRGGDFDKLRLKARDVFTSPTIAVLSQ